MENKKETREQLERRIKNALVFVPRDKTYKSVFFGDKALRLEVTQDKCVISTLSHRHVFEKVNNQGICRTWLYTESIIDMAFENDCKTKDGDYSYALLLDVLKRKEDKTEYNIAVYFSWYLLNIFQPLYSIGESEIDSFLVYEAYLHNIARNAVLLSEKTNDMTNKQFLQGVVKYIQDFIEDLEERVLFQKHSDEDMAKEQMDAMNDAMNESFMKGQANGSKD